METGQADYRPDGEKDDKNLQTSKNQNKTVKENYDNEKYHVRPSYIQITYHLPINQR